MQYLDWFARGLQSRVLQPLTHRLLRLAKYIVRHPFKSIWFVIKAYMATLLFVLLTVFFFGAVSAKAQANIFDQASNGVPAQVTRGCDTGDVTISSYIAEQNARDNLPRTESTWYADAKTNDGYIETYFPPDGQGNCQERYWVKSSGGQINSQTGERFGQYESRDVVSISGFPVESPSCDNLGNNADGSFAYPDHKHLGSKSDGSFSCFTAQDLEDVDTCDLSNPDVLGSSSSPDKVCFHKPDGSKCAMDKYSANGQFAYAQALEPSSCYEGQYAINPYEEPPVTPPAGDNCQDIGGGVDFCPTDPANVCHPITGQCPTGCGSFGIGGDTVFGCLKDQNSTCDPTQEICSTPQTPDDVIVDPIMSTDDPRFQTTEGTNTILTGTNQRLTTIGSNIQETTQAVRTVGTGIGQATQGIEEIKEELSTTKSVGFPDAGELHTANDYETRNYGTVMQAAIEQMQQAELSKAVNEFFEISLTGSCPIYTANVPYLNSTITIDQFCGSVMNQVWPIIRVIILLVFSILAFRVAVL